MSYAGTVCVPFVALYIIDLNKVCFKFKKQNKTEKKTGAGLGRTSQEQDNRKLRQWWSHLKNSDLDYKTKQFQWKLSHNGLYTGILLHEIDPEIAETYDFVNLKNHNATFFLKSAMYFVNFGSRYLTISIS